VSWAIAGRTLVGVGVAVVFVPTLKILAEWFHPREFARMTGLLLAVGGIGSLTAASPLVWLSNAFGWRNSFIFVGGFTLLIAIWVGFFVRNRPSDLGWNLSFNIEQKDKIEIGLMKGVKQVLSNPYFWPLAIWFFLDFAIFFSFAGLWGGPYLIHVYGMTKAESGNILNMLAVGLVVGAPALSWLSDKVFKRRKPVLILAAAVMLLMTALLTVYTDQLPVWSLYLIFFGMTGFGNAVGAIGFAMTKELFPIQISGTATGIVNLFPFVGGAIFQPLLGDILERYPKIGDTFTSAGYHAAFITLLVVAILAFVAALFSRETLKKN
jgi:sugar phosphate permease